MGLAAADEGCRYYVSIMGDVIDGLRGKPMSRPPPSLASLLWVDEAEAAAPHISEMGWTVVPPGMPPQSVHADLVAGPSICPSI